MNKATVAILGATSHMAKGLINQFLGEPVTELHLFGRSKERIQTALKSIAAEKDICFIHEGFDAFLSGSYDVIINCVGVGTVNKLQGDFTRYFTLTEYYDNLVLEFLQKSPETLYVSFSSGVIYGRGLSAPADDNTVNTLDVNHLAKEDSYMMVRLYTEAKHRAFSNLRIADLRVFSYFSRFCDLTDKYFITDIINSVLSGNEFITGENDIIRDYIHPEDLFSLIQCCMKKKTINSAFDVVSAKPVSKWEIIDFFKKEYGLTCTTKSDFSFYGATGSKNIYCSNSTKAATIGYTPKYTAMQSVQMEAKHIVNIRRNKNDV
jgi:nucleoside-diphosphate-sugar epimerase